MNLAHTTFENFKYSRFDIQNNNYVSDVAYKPKKGIKGWIIYGEPEEIEENFMSKRAIEKKLLSEVESEVERANERIIKEFELIDNIKTGFDLVKGQSVWVFIKKELVQVRFIRFAHVTERYICVDSEGNQHSFMRVFNRHEILLNNVEKPKKETLPEIKIGSELKFNKHVVKVTDISYDYEYDLLSISVKDLSIDGVLKEDGEVRVFNFDRFKQLLRKWY